MDHRADFHQQVTARPQSLGRLGHQPLDHFRARGPANSATAPNFRTSAQTVSSAVVTYGGLLTIKSNCRSAGTAANRSLSTNSTARPRRVLGVFFGHRQGGRTEVDGRHAAIGQVLGQADGDDAAAGAHVGDRGIRDQGSGIRRSKMEVDQLLASDPDPLPPSPFLLCP